MSSIRINVWGGAGDDVFELQAGAGNNRLYGEEGEDTFNIQGSNNTVYGGEGTNAINDNGSGTVSVDVPGANSSIVDLAARETKEVVINGIKYTVSNKSGSSSQSLIYSLNADGSIKFQGSSLTITGEANKAHNVVLELSNSTFYGGNLSDNITSRGQSASNIIYGGAGDDIIQASTSSNLIYGGAGLTLLELRPQIIRFLLRVEMII